MRAFYSDHFALPLPEGHTLPMAKYARLRERVISEELVPPDRLVEAPLADGVAVNLAGGTHHAFADCGEGYAEDVDAIVTIHSNTIAVAAGLHRRGAGIPSSGTPPCHNTSGS